MSTWLDINGWLDSDLLIFAPVLISGFFTVIIARITTKQTIKLEDQMRALQATLKIGDYRQVWINDLRDCMSKFHGHSVSARHDTSDDLDFYCLCTKIQLLMNPEDPQYTELLIAMHSFFDSSTIDKLSKYNNNSEFIKISQSILKREWDRLKKESHNVM